MDSLTPRECVLFMLYFIGDCAVYTQVLSYQAGVSVSIKQARQRQLVKSTRGATDGRSEAAVMANSWCT